MRKVDKTKWIDACIIFVIHAFFLNWVILIIDGIILFIFICYVIYIIHESKERGII